MSSSSVRLTLRNPAHSEPDLKLDAAGLDWTVLKLKHEIGKRYCYCLKK